MQHRREIEASAVWLLVDPSRDVTGAFTTALQQARALAGQVRMVLVLPEGHRIPATLLQDFWQVETIPLINPRKNPLALLSYLPTLLWGSLRLRWLCRKHGASRLQLNDFYLLQGVVLRLLGYRGCMLQWVRCEPARFAGGMAVPILKLVTKAADEIVAVSRFIQQKLPAGIKSTLLYEYYDGPKRTARQWAPGEIKTCLYVGNYIPGKGQDMALAAFARAAAQVPELRLHFIGSTMQRLQNQQYLQRLQVQAAQLGVLERVRFDGFAQSLFPYFEQAYMALNFSTSESFSMTVLEASGAGVPVIATASGGPQEILKENATGFLIPVGDVDAAASKILYLAQHPYIACAMSEAAANYISAHFSKAQFVERLNSLVAGAGFEPTTFRL